MGIQDRDYYRNEGPSIFDSLIPSGLVCRWLIGINVTVWILQMATMAIPPPRGEEIFVPNDGWVTDWFILDTTAVMHGQVWRLLTSAFLHSTDGFSHIMFNMIFLWWFGSDVEQMYGRKEFLAIYLVSALLGGVTFELWSLVRGEHMRALGASGAVTTLLVLCACHYPHRIVYIFLMLPMPIWLFAVFNVAKDAYVMLSGQRTNVAVVVHLAGAAFAIGYYKWQHRLTDYLPSLTFWKAARPRTRLKLFQPEVEKEVPVAVSVASEPSVMDEHLEAKLDAVLEKIAKTGKESLTTQEQEILKQAAEMYKRRRT